MRGDIGGRGLLGSPGVETRETLGEGMESREDSQRGWKSCSEAGSSMDIAFTSSKSFI